MDWQLLVCFLWLLCSAKNGRCDSIEEALVNDFKDTTLKVLKKPPTSFGNIRQFSRDSTLLANKALSVGSILAKIAKGTRIATVTMDQLKDALEKISTGLPAEIRLDNQDSLLDNLKLEYSLRIDGQLDSYFVELHHLADSSRGVVITDYLMKGCSDLLYSPKGMLQYLKLRLLTQCRLDLLKKELHGTAEEAKQLFMNISATIFQSADAEQKDKWKRLQNEVEEHKNAVMLVDEIASAIKEADIKTPEDAIQVIEKAKRAIDLLGPDNTCMLRNLAHKHDFRRQTIFDGVELFRRDMINITLLNSFCLRLLGEDEGTVLTKMNDFFNTVKEIESHVVEYASIVLERYWNQTIPKISYFAFANNNIKTKDFNKTAIQFRDKLDQFGQEESAHSVYIFKSYAKEMYPLIKFFDFTCPQDICYYNAYEFVAVLVVRIKDIDQEQLGTRVMQGKEWVNQRAKQIVDSIDARSDAATALAILKNVQTSVDFSSSPFKAYGLIRDWESAFFYFFHVSHSTGRISSIQHYNSQLDSSFNLA
ncbi:hypothetical protein M3Y98_00926900 [Aphelenchoides besseyi]|nr:hypothetical protein M3Y98_00926900 [Aphelenchoides besseyi]